MNNCMPKKLDNLDEIDKFPETVLNMWLYF